MNGFNANNAILFPPVGNPRWLVKKSCLRSFWLLIIPNGKYGIAKRWFVRVVLPFALPLLRSATISDDIDFLYLGVDDGKQTELAVKFTKSGVLFRKSAKNLLRTKYIDIDAEYMMRLSDPSDGTFPRFLSYDHSILSFYGSIPSYGFNPKLVSHREKLVDALIKMYKIFPVERNEQGIVCCRCHGDLNRWNMFIDEEQTLHIFDFETMGVNYLGFDLLTAYKDEVPAYELKIILDVDLKRLYKGLGIEESTILNQLDLLAKLSFK